MLSSSLRTESESIEEPLVFTNACIRQAVEEKCSTVEASLAARALIHRTLAVARLPTELDGNFGFLHIPRIRVQQNADQQSNDTYVSGLVQGGENGGIVL